MKKFAQIVNKKLHWKFAKKDAPQFAPDIVIVEITGLKPEPQEGWDWDGKAFTAPAITLTDKMVKAYPAALVATITRYLDEQAKRCGFGSMLDMVSFANSGIGEYASCAADAIKWRDQVRQRQIELLATLDANNPLTAEEIIKELPPCPWK
jgi:hypothetical protein